MPPATIGEAEAAFVRRKFARSLRLANCILESGCSGSGEPALLLDDASGRAPRRSTAAKGRGREAPVIHCASPLLPGLDGWKHDAVTIPATDSSSPRSATDPPAASPPSWRVRLANETSICDRAAAIAIQSIYEMGGAGGGSDGDHCADEDSRNEYLMADLSALHRHYREADMPIGLACIYVQFCSAMGWRGAALSVAVDVLGHILGESQPGRSGAAAFELDLLHEDWFMEACEELIDLVLTELLPRVENAEDCRALLWRLKGQRETTSSTQQAQSIYISEAVQPSSVDVLVTNLTDTDNLSSSFHPSFESIVQQCGENLRQMQIEANDVPAKAAVDDSLLAAADKVSARSAAASSADHLDEHADEDPPAGVFHSLSEFFHSNVVEPLWESEDRWTNRAAVAAVGVSSVMLWRRRKRLGGAVRSTGHAAVAPFREILEAISHPQAQK